MKRKHFLLSIITVLVISIGLISCDNPGIELSAAATVNAGRSIANSFEQEAFENIDDFLAFI